jgi:hypothetical protein
MLAVPFLLGIAVTRPTGWQVALGGAAAAGYLASATAQTWARARARQRYTTSLTVYASTAAVLSIALVVTHPGLLLALVVLAPAGAITLVAAKLGRARGVTAGFAQVAQALVLVPAAASLAGPFDASEIAKTTFLAAVYLVGTLLAVRSVIREQGNAGFAALSVGFHVAATAAGAILLRPPFVVLLGLLAIRPSCSAAAATLPPRFVRSRWEWSRRFWLRASSGSPSSRPSRISDPGAGLRYLTRDPRGPPGVAPSPPFQRQAQTSSTP